MASGNVVGEKQLDDAKTFNSWKFLKAVDVLAEAPASAAIVTFGDSITDGARSTEDTNRRWPDILAQRLQADKKTAGLGVLNEGISGNRVLHDGWGPNALARFDRDVLTQAGVKYLILMESINDIGHPIDHQGEELVSAQDLIAGFTQLAERAHIHGIKVFAATLTPYEGAKYASASGEAIRTAVNTWIRSSLRTRWRYRLRPGHPRSRQARHVPSRVRLWRPPPPRRRWLQGHGRVHQPETLLRKEIKTPYAGGGLFVTCLGLRMVLPLVGTIFIATIGSTKRSGTHVTK